MTNIRITLEKYIEFLKLSEEQIFLVVSFQYFGNLFVASGGFSFSTDVIFHGQIVIRGDFLGSISVIICLFLCCFIVRLCDFPSVPHSVFSIEPLNGKQNCDFEMFSPILG